MISTDRFSPATQCAPSEMHVYVCVCQFTPFGRLIDKSFQMPRELQCMQAD